MKYYPANYSVQKYKYSKYINSGLKDFFKKYFFLGSNHILSVIILLGDILFLYLCNIFVPLFTPLKNSELISTVIEVPLNTLFSPLSLSIAIFIMISLVRKDYEISIKKDYYNIFYSITFSLMLSYVSVIFISISFHPFFSVPDTKFIVFIACGSLAVFCWRSISFLWVRQYPNYTVSEKRKIFLIGFQEDIDFFQLNSLRKNNRIKVVGSTVLRKTESNVWQHEDMSLAVSIIRFLKPQDIIILLPWNRKSLIEDTVKYLRCVPSCIYLWPAHILAKMNFASIASIGDLPAIKVSDDHFNSSKVFIKRYIDIFLSSLAIIMLIPVMAFTALAIKLDSNGPVFYRQRRYGFNQEPFSMLKFRSMQYSPQEKFKQATRNDPRITRIGRFIRKWNIDELPQLINVLKGDMSLVGPRPHALAHDQHYMKRISDYAHRHNVLPGITGWAQVNGLRGETSTDTAMIQRVEHDIYYIENWSLMFDVWILFLTVFSSKAYANAG